MPLGKEAEHIFKTFTFPDSVRQPEVYAATDTGADISLISESAYQALPEGPKLNLLPEVKEELDRMLEEDIIEEVTEPTNWCTPMVSVIKVAEHSFAAVSSNSRDGACFKLDKQTWRRKTQWYREDNFSKSTH